MAEDLLDDNTALGYLRAEHRQIDELLNTCLTFKQPEFIGQAAAFLLQELQIHFTLERDLFFPVIGKLIPERQALHAHSAEGEMTRARQDNRTIVALTERLLKEKPGEAPFHNILTELAYTFRHHCYLVESYVFMLVEMNDADTHDELVKLASQLKERKAAVLAVLHSPPPTHLASREAREEHRQALDIKPQTKGEEGTAHGA